MAGSNNWWADIGKLQTNIWGMRDPSGHQCGFSCEPDLVITSRGHRAAVGWSANHSQIKKARLLGGVSRFKSCNFGAKRKNYLGRSRG